MFPSLSALSLQRKDEPAPFSTSAASSPLDIGMKRGRSARTTMAPRSTSGLASLDTNGVATFPLVVDGADFITQLRACSNVWLHTNLETMLNNPPPTMTKHADVAASKLQWDALPPETKRHYMEHIDLQIDEGMKIVFDNEYIKTRIWWQTMPGGVFFRKALMYVKMGNVGMALGNMAGAWTAKGFGLWAHIVPDLGLTMVMNAMDTMRTLGLEPGVPEHFPHPIYKPPGGAALEIHHDQMAPAQLLQSLRAHVASTDPSTSAWVRKHGIQMLAHLQGGTGTSDGATFIVGPMTPTKLLICLEAYSAGRLGGDFAAWNAKGVGKVNLDVEAHLDGFNHELVMRGFESVGLLAAAPYNVVQQGGGDHGGFVVGFPVGWLHGSFSNHKTESLAARQGGRVSITLPITMRGSTQVADPRIPDRLHSMAILSSGGHTAAQYAAAEAWLANDRREYATGPTHANPHKVVDLIRHPDAPGPTGPFYSIAVKPDTVEQYLSAVAQLSAPPAPPEEEVPPHPGDAWHEPPPVSVLDADVRLLKVKQPWAEMLVKGIKDVENRTWALTPTTGFPAWVLVVSSLERPTGATMADLRSRLTRVGHGLALANGTNPDDYDYGCILGMIKIDHCTSTPTPPLSVWYNPPDVAWVVSDAWEFENPIRMDPDDGMQTQARLVIRPQYRARIEEEMAKLTPGLR